MRDGASLSKICEKKRLLRACSYFYEKARQFALWMCKSGRTRLTNSGAVRDSSEILLLLTQQYFLRHSKLK
jgi:hypothetical protein